MTVSERLAYLLLGCGIGFMVGYVVRSITCRKDIQNMLGKMRDDDNRPLHSRVTTNLALFLVVGLTAWAAISSQFASNRSEDATDKVKHTNFVTCQNANEAREANYDLWNFVIKLSLANQQDSSPARTHYLKVIRAWIKDIYRPHDCTKLSKKYPIPPPPKVISIPPVKPSK